MSELEADAAQLRRLAHYAGYLAPYKDPRLVAWAVRDWPELLVRSENQQAIWFEPRCRWWEGRKRWWKWQVRLYAQTLFSPNVLRFDRHHTDMDLLLWAYCVSNHRSGDISVGAYTRDRPADCYIEAASGRIKATLNRDLDLFLDRLTKVAVFIRVNLPIQSESNPRQP